MIHENNSNTYDSQKALEEIDLKILVKILLGSKKIIIGTILVFILLAVSYIFQKDSQYQASTLIEIGSYQKLNGDRSLIEPLNNLIDKLMLDFYKKNSNAKIITEKSQKQALYISYEASSDKVAEKLLNDAITFIKNRHSLLISEKFNPSLKKIDFINNQIDAEKLNAKLKLSYAIENVNSKIDHMRNKSKLRISSQIKDIDIEIPTLKAKIKQLKDIVFLENENILLLQTSPNLKLQRAVITPTLEQVVHSYESEIINNNLKINQLYKNKSFLEEQYGQDSSEVFKLLLQKNQLEDESQIIEETGLKSIEMYKITSDLIKLEAFVNQTPVKTKLVYDISVDKVKSKNISIILFAVFIGFIFSILITSVRYFVFQEQK